MRDWNLEVLCLVKPDLMLIHHPSQLFARLRYNNNQLCRVTGVVGVVHAQMREPGRRGRHIHRRSGAVRRTGG